MKNSKHGWLVAVYVPEYSDAVHVEFCETESEANKEKEYYEVNNDVECVTVDEVFHDLETGEYVAA